MNFVKYTSLTDDSLSLEGCFEYVRRLQHHTIYLSMDCYDYENKYDEVCAELKEAVRVTKISPMEANCRCDVLIVVDYMTNTFELRAFEQTRISHILDIIPRLIRLGDDRTPVERLLIDKEDTMMGGCDITVYRPIIENYDDDTSEEEDDDASEEEEDDESTVFMLYQEPLLRQLDTFMGA
jgi:hypothetical protein